MTEKDRSRVLSSPTRALQLLDAVADSRVPVRPPELGRALGWSRAAVHQHLATLVSAGWLEQLSDGRYRLALRAIRLGTMALQQAGLDERVTGLLEQVSFALRESTFLAVLQGANAHVTVRVPAPGRRIQVDVTGSDFDLETSASGRVLAAFADPAELGRLAAAGAAIAPDRVLAEVRRRGFTVAEHTDDPGDETTAVAVPLLDYRGRCIAAMGVLAPVVRLDLEKASAALVDAARRFDEMWHAPSGDAGEAPISLAPWA